MKRSVDAKKLLVLCLFSVILISFVAGVVSADDSLDAIKRGRSGEGVTDSGGSIWDKITKGFSLEAFNISTLTEGTGFAQVLLFILLTLLVYAISSFVPFLDGKPTIAFFVSAIVGILAAFWLKPEEVFSILLAYSTLGIVLTSIFPFILVAIIAKQLSEKGHTMFSKVLWIALGVVIIMKWFTATEIGTFGKFAYPIVLVLVGIMLLWEHKINLLFFKVKAREWGAAHKEELIAEYTAELTRLGVAIENTTAPAGKKVLMKKYNARVDDIRKLGVGWDYFGEH